MERREILPVFYDPAGWRRRNLLRIGLPTAVIFTLITVTFILSVLVNPVLPKLNLRQLSGLPGISDFKPQTPELITNRNEQKALRARTALEQYRKRHPCRKNAAAAPGPRDAHPLVSAFYVNWDDSSYQSLKRHVVQLDQIIPEWIRLQDSDQPVVAEIDQRALSLIRRERPDLPIIPIIHNSKDGKWEPRSLARQIESETARARLVNDLGRFVSDNHFNGVCVDFEEVPNGSQKNLLAFMKSLYSAFHSKGWIVMQAAPFDDPAWNYRAYAATSDYLMLMAYDEHWNESDPGSVAGQEWFEEMLERRMSELDPARTFVCIGGYGYDWSKGEETSELTFQEAVLEARDSEAKIGSDPATHNPYFRFQDEHGKVHSVWFLDAVTAFNEKQIAETYNVAGFALWRMGSEDPSLWSVFGNRQLSSSPDELKRIVYGYDIDFEGMGEILEFEASPKEGSRDIKVDAKSGLIESSHYQTIPSSYVIRRTGWHPGMVALTFDDGPDERWTPEILDILKREKVPATFFILGENGQAYPRLVNRIVADGHDIGNHSYTHPNLGEIPGRVTQLELSATQRLIESLTGRSTRLFRAPYFGDAEPQTADEVEPAAIADRLGYIIVGLRVDPDDWARPGVDQIVERTVAGIENSNPDEGGQVVLLHDSGGDRSQTVDALPILISRLREKGYRFVTVSQLAGISRDEAMPAMPAEHTFFSKADAVAFYAMAVGGWTLRWIFLLGIVLGLGRLILIGALALAQRIRSRRREREFTGSLQDAPFVSIITAAFNEEKVIAQTIRSLLSSRYQNFEIIIVDDGSTDRTSEIVRKQFGDEERVRLFTKANAGKAEALNFALHYAKGDLVIALDADTLFVPDTIRKLARRFEDPRVGAIAGNAKVGNRINLITRWQALEYITAQNLDRRAFASLNCITVVPGAVGAWRRELIDDLGGFASETLAEDQDLTLKVRKRGYTIGYEEDAVAWTEAPDTLRGLAKQRFRWAYGTLQCLWKHRDALLNPRFGALGFVALPNVWIFQVLFPLISPVMDLMFVWTLVSAGLERWEHPNEYLLSNLTSTLGYYALFLAVDALAAAFAFALERREQWSLLWWLFLQRFCYRQVMYYVMVRSVMTALHGTIVGWGKLERKATVTIDR